MNIQRQWVTPLTAGAFLLSAVTGVLIFFHLDAGANKFVHEWLSWVLLIGAALHTVANFNGLKAHLRSRRGQALVAVFVLALGLSFIPLGSGRNEPPFMAPIRALGGADMTTLARLAKLSPEQLRARLATAGVQVGDDGQTLVQLVGEDPRRQMQALNQVFQAR